MKKSLLLIVALLASLSAWAQNAPALGDLFYSDGTFSSTLVEGKTPIGVVAYLGSDSFSENGVTLRDGVTTLNSYGLVLCLKNAADNVQWSTVSGNCDLGDEAAISTANDNDLMRSTDVSGYTNTNTLVQKNASNYPAATAAWNYADLEAPTNTTGWFLPSIQQWVRILMGLGEMSESSARWNVQFDTNPIDKLNTAMEKAGEGNCTLISGNNVAYWSSSEDSRYEYRYSTCLDSRNGGYYFAAYLKNAAYTSYPARVRPILAFSYEEDTPTGIVDLNAVQPKSGQRYNLMGQPVGKDYKGIVIEDGKKLIVR